MDGNTRLHVNVSWMFGLLSSCHVSTSCSGQAFPYVRLASPALEQLVITRH